MKTESVTLLEWQERFGTEEACLSQLIHYRWPGGFICPHCGHDQGYFIGGRHTGGKRGRGAEGKTPVLVAVGNRGKKAGYVAMEAVASVSKKAVSAFARCHINPAQLVRSDALSDLSSLGETQHHAARVTPAGKAGEWLPWVQVTIGNLKAFLLGTYHGVSGKYLQEYLNEFCYRFNRRRALHELPLRLLNACVQHVPIRCAGLC